jgi:hypothetical protein
LGVWFVSLGCLLKESFLPPQISSESDRSALVAPLFTAVPSVSHPVAPRRVVCEFPVGVVLRSLYSKEKRTIAKEKRTGRSPYKIIQFTGSDGHRNPTGLVRRRAEQMLASRPLSSVVGIRRHLIRSSALLDTAAPCPPLAYRLQPLNNRRNGWAARQGLILHLTRSLPLTGGFARARRSGVISV